MTTHGQFHWNELMTRDVEKAKAFYTDIVGWSFDGMDMGDGTTYWVAMANGAPAGGLFDVTGTEFDGGPEMWMAYLHVDDVDAAAAKVATHGGKVAREPFDVPGVGRIAMIEQPDGAMVGWITPAQQQG